jgi:hypothetical protein
VTFVEGLALAGQLGPAAAIVWGAAKVKAAVEALQKEVSKLETVPTRVAILETRTDDIEGDVDKLNSWRVFHSASHGDGE